MVTLAMRVGPSKRTPAVRGRRAVPEVGCSVPHHLVLLQRQPLNDALAVLHELAAQGLLNGLHHT